MLSVDICVSVRARGSARWGWALTVLPVGGCVSAVPRGCGPERVGAWPCGGRGARALGRAAARARRPAARARLGSGSEGDRGVREEIELRKTNDRGPRAAASTIYSDYGLATPILRACAVRSLTSGACAPGRALTLLRTRPLEP